jgi:hypothetical protein
LAIANLVRKNIVFFPFFVFSIIDLFVLKNIYFLLVQKYSVYYLSLFDLIYFSLSAFSKSKDNSTRGDSSFFISHIIVDSFFF